MCYFTVIFNILCDNFFSTNLRPFSYIVSVGSIRKVFYQKATTVLNVELEVF
ncbi:AAEL002297-PA [Aedes aegypti]|uniref:AAEL002297-PA n=1 Tax=Aedes aegypti TaxID=7159 RepID=Q17IN7_AEDAE|nr:AAEL002297-PA [Aedes aegypti]